jgi:hypothetical protein
MPPLEITSSDMQKAVQDYQQIEQRVQQRIKNRIHTAQGSATSSPVSRVAALFGIKISNDSAGKKSGAARVK